MLFLGLPLLFLGGEAIERLLRSSGLSNLSGMVFRRPFIFGFGVPVLFFGLSNDFLGRPLPLFSIAGRLSSQPFKGTVIVVVRSARRLAGEPSRGALGARSSNCSACTVNRIRHGLVGASLVVDLVGDLLFLREGGVEI